MKFVVFAPEYRANSAGIVMLYKLCDELKKLGYSAEIMQMTKPYQVDDDTILVYPEVVDGNPLKAKNVVRYFLNREGFASGNKVNAGPNDFILAFHKLYHPSPNAFVRFENVHPSFYFAGTKPTLERKLDCTYIGKGSMYSDKCKVIDGTIEITRTAPAEKEALADLLRQTRFLFTYDICSAIVNEAIVCGTVVVPLMFHPYKADELEYPFATVSENAIFIPEDYEEKRKDFLSVILNLDLEKQTAEFAQKAISYFSGNPNGDGLLCRAHLSSS